MNEISISCKGRIIGNDLFSLIKVALWWNEEERSPDLLGIKSTAKTGSGDEMLGSKKLKIKKKKKAQLEMVVVRQEDD